MYDNDGDGIDDCVDRRPLPETSSEPVIIDLGTVKFAFDSDQLSSSARARLDEAIAILAHNQGLSVEISGHTDSVGSHAYNQGLSERRAQAVYQYLLSRGVPSHRVTNVVGYGETRPVAPNTHDDGSDNPQGRAANRRAELGVSK